MIQHTGTLYGKPRAWLYFREMQGTWSIFDRCNGAAQQEQYQEWRGDDDTRIAIDDAEAST